MARMRAAWFFGKSEDGSFGINRSQCRTAFFISAGRGNGGNRVDERRDAVAVRGVVRDLQVHAGAAFPKRASRRFARLSMRSKWATSFGVSHGSA